VSPVAVLRSPRTFIFVAIPYEGDNLNVQYDPGERWLYARWRGRQSPEDIRRGGRALLAAMRSASIQHACSHVLNDNRDVVGSWSHSLEWTSKEWFPQMVAAGLKRFAWVLSSDGLAQLSAVRVKLDTGPITSGTMSVFADIDEAKRWLAANR
jgi:hypothetical protein